MTAKKGNEYTAYDKKHQAEPDEVAKRVARNRARREMMREGKVHKGDGMEVDHKQQLALGGSYTAKSNLQVVPAAVNRSKNKRPSK